MVTSSTHPPVIALPAPRQLLTSILDSLFSSPTPDRVVDNTPNTKAEIVSEANTIITTTSTLSTSGHENDKHRDITTESDERSPNPLETLSQEKRALLTTLHVLIPPPTLLQALDLLDRGLVSKVVWQAEEPTLRDDSIAPDRNASVSNQHHEPRLDLEESSTATHHSVKQPPTSSLPSPTRVFYQVHSFSSATSSLHQSRSRYRESTTAYGNQNKSYIVNLGAWNCNCAAFSFSAFPYSSSSSFNEWKHIFPEDDSDEDEEGSVEEDTEELDVYHPYKPVDVSAGSKERASEKREVQKQTLNHGGEEGEYGALSFDGRNVGREGRDNVPICKHLLAVLLGEKWDVMRKCVDIRMLYGESGMDECAGLAVD